ncbi:MAG: hypothetical protein KUG56_09015, partial [Kordiimonadaceae bacterium]|nr:hypothetical protein [Kordiimonadaceae bacterium]
PNSGFARLGQPSLTCTWIRTPDNGNVPLNATVFTDLGHDRGYLESVTDGTYYYASLNAKPVHLSDQDFPLHCMKELPFVNAIQMVACPISFVSRKGKKINEPHLSVTLMRFDGSEPTIEETRLPRIDGERGYTQTLVTARGTIRLMRTRYTPVGDKPGGLYLITDNKPVKIWEGYPDVGDVSADGCKLAFTAKKKPYSISPTESLLVWDICKALDEAA